MVDTVAAPVSRVSGIKLWPVSSLLRAIAESIETRFNPVAVQGEITGFSRAASGHCYFSLKDEHGQIRCAMFRRATGLLDFSPRDGLRVELRGKLGVYDARGELQLVAESMQKAGQGSLFEQFIKLRDTLEAEGLFDAGRKRALPLMPKAVGVVTSLGAAALHDVVTALKRRAPHIPVVIYPASVQGTQAAAELRQALTTAGQRNEVDVVLLVRGGGAIEDLWAFNDEQLARAIAASPVPVVSGVGHETDFTIADFCADVRAPTPTAAAELSARPQDIWMGALTHRLSGLQQGVDRQLQAQCQRLDLAAARFGRPSHFVTRQQARLTAHAQGLQHASRAMLNREYAHLGALTADFPKALVNVVQQKKWQLANSQVRLDSVSPSLVLKRGYAWLTNAAGHAITSVGQTRTGQQVRATLADGEVDLSVTTSRLI